LLGLAVCGVCLACLTVVSKLYRYLGNSSHAGAVWQVGVSWGRLGGHHQRGRFHRMGGAWQALQGRCTVDKDEKDWFLYISPGKFIDGGEWKATRARASKAADVNSSPVVE
jgi:hypothetical protein